MKIPNNFYRTTSAALILDNLKRFLLVYQDSKYWDFPGGGIDFGEHPHDTIKRELKEEMGIEVLEIKKQPSYFVTALNVNGLWKCDVLYETKVKSLDFTSSEECRKIRFFTKEEAKKVKLYPIIENFLKEFDPKNH